MSTTRAISLVPESIPDIARETGKSEQFLRDQLKHNEARNVVGVYVMEYYEVPIHKKKLRYNT